MPPPVANKLVVSLICLEDVSPDAGPLVYYPGSHKLPPYRFSHGELHAVPTEMPKCLSYVDQQIAQAGIEPKVFLGRAGDVFLWHGQLLHGGSPINDLSRTRKTLVTHYWRAQDMQPHQVIKVHETGYYYNREHQRVAQAN
jgi:phytanoyl-CoA hydroxylase